MKKRKLLSVLALVLCFTMLFAACGKKDDDAEETTSNTNPPAPELSFMEKIFNSEVESATKPLTSMTQLDDVTGTISSIGGSIVLFTDASGNNTVKKVFSAYTKSIVQTFTDRENEVYTVTSLNARYYPDSSNEENYNIFTYRNAFMVTTADPTKNGKITQTAIYNAKGELIAAADGEATPEVYYYNGDASYKSYWFIFDDVLYSTNTLDGSILKIADVPEYMTLPYVTDESENYYYYIGQSDVKIYDKQFKLVSEWAYPSFATFKYGINLLNNGNIVAQYSVRLPEDAAEYDVLSNGNKYDLVTVIVSPADASEKELNADFIIHDVETSYASKLFYGVSLYADGVENVATVSYI